MWLRFALPCRQAARDEQQRSQRELATATAELTRVRAELRGSGKALEDGRRRQREGLRTSSMLLVRKVAVLREDCSVLKTEARMKMQMLQCAPGLLPPPPNSSSSAAVQQQ